MQLQIKVRHLPPVMKKYLMQQIQCISLDPSDQKATQSSHRHCSGQSASKGNPVLLRPGLCTSEVGLLSSFSEEKNRHAQEFPKPSRKTVRWQELDHKNSVTFPTFCCQHLWFYNQFSFLAFFPSSPSCSPFAKNLANSRIHRF